MFSRIFKFISRVVLPEVIVVGIDVQDRHISGVAALEQGGETKILTSGVYDLSEGAVEGGELRDAGAFKKAIKSLVEKIPKGKFGLAGEPIFVLSLPPNHVYTETAIFPQMTEEELHRAVKLRIETSLPWPAAQSYVDWSKLEYKEQKQAPIFFAAISKTVADGYFKVFLEENWRLGACEFHLFSLARLIGDRKANSFIFVLIDDDGVEFAVFASGNILTHYLESVGSPDGIEAHKGLIEDKVKQLTLFAEGNYGVKVERVYIFDKVSLEKVSSSITSITGIPTEIFVPTPPGVDLRLSTAYGASKRSYSPRDSLINLLPPALGGRYQENLFLKTMGLWTRVAAVFLGTFLLAFLGVYILLVSQKNMLLIETENFRATFEEKRKAAAPLIQKAEFLNRIVQEALNAKAERTTEGKRIEVIEGLARKNGAVLLNIGLGERDEIAANFTISTREAALEFRDDLAGAGLFSSVEIPLSQLAAEKNLSITLTLKP